MSLYSGSFLLCTHLTISLAIFFWQIVKNAGLSDTFFFFFLSIPAPPELSPLPPHDPLPIGLPPPAPRADHRPPRGGSPLPARRAPRARRRRGRCAPLRAPRRPPRPRARRVRRAPGR